LAPGVFDDEAVGNGIRGRAERMEDAPQSSGPNGDGALTSPRRLEALRRAEVLDTPAEEAFDRLTRLAARALHVPVSLVSLVDADRQFFKSCTGTLPEPWHSARQTPLTHSFCQHAVTSARPLVIDDAREHPLVQDNGAISDLGVVAYAGVPLVMSDGQVLGSFCVIDNIPHRWTEDELEILHTLAASAVGELELRRLLRERRCAEDELRRSNDILRAVTEGTGDAIFVKDRLGRYLMINPAAAEMVGKPADQIVEHDDTDVFDPETAARVMAHDRRVMATGGVEAEEGPYTLSCGRRVLSSFKAPYRDAAGNVVGVIGIARDVTERLRAEQELKHAKEQAEAATAVAEAANRAKDQFLAVLSHELRTPLAPVLALAGSWQGDESVPPQLREDLELVRRNVELEVRLIEDLLDLTRITRGKLVLCVDAVDAHAVLRNALRTCPTEEVQRKKLRLESELSAASAFVSGDPARLHQVFSNLLSNAIKFTPDGGRITARTSQAADGRFIVEVSDTGVGIEPRALEKIFEAFEQGPEHVTRQFGGLGLGLAICKTLVDAMGGRITAHSDGPGCGAIFRVELVPAEAPPEAPSPRPGAEAPAAGADGAATDGDAEGDDGAHNLRILLVDDHVDTSKVMARLLGRLGYQVRTAGTVRAAVEAMQSEPADLVISDLGLPDGHGHDLMRRLIVDHEGVKGIALSGYGTEEDLRKSREAGFVSHLTKPTDFNHLVDTIRELSR
jgi:PAS domain S-box-containing protein